MQQLWPFYDGQRGDSSSLSSLVTATACIAAEVTTASGARILHQGNESSGVQLTLP